MISCLQLLPHHSLGILTNSSTAVHVSVLACSENFSCLKCQQYQQEHRTKIVTASFRLFTPLFDGLFVGVLQVPGVLDDNLTDAAAENSTSA
jgi:hypothetical protein